METINQTERLRSQMNFLLEVEKLKAVYRQNMVYDGSRQENSAEHSWHLALMAVLLAEHVADPAVNTLRVIEMLLIHDIVEIDAGDTFLYDEVGVVDQEAREEEAARRIFGLLPPDQCGHALALWHEFDARKTPDALFAAALDNMQPVFNHWLSGGVGIKNHNLSASQVIAKKQFIEEASPALWAITLETIQKSEAAGFYRREDDQG